jgi:nucleoside-diphosphate-sugar epimerase
VEHSDAVREQPGDTSSGDRNRGSVLLTGATGFLGSHIAEALITEGWAVRCTVRPTSDLRWIESLPIDRVTADMTSESQLEAALEDIDVVVHSAGLTRAKSDTDYFRVNAEGTQKLAEGAIAANVSRFVLVSSLAARGPDRRASDRDSGVNADRPTSVYGESKLAGERRLFEAVARSNGAIRHVILRPGGIYGPRDEDSLTLFRMARSGLLPVPTTPGRLQPVYVRDVAEAVVRSVARSGLESGPFALGGAEIVTWEDMRLALEKAVGRQVRLVRLPGPFWQVTGTVAEAASRLLGMTPQFDRRTADDLARLDWTVSLDSVRDALGWTPQTSLRDAMLATADWYREKGWLKA